MSKIYYLVSKPIYTLDIPADVLVEPTKNNAIRILPRKIGSRHYKEKIIQHAFSDLQEKGYIIQVNSERLIQKFKVLKQYPGLQEKLKQEIEEQEKNT
ncbi:MAG: hypothetical protein NZZ41_03945 [Candidatus Dojkabacteria bacterium]|nr:hypothetical protein [Candidatus Dojkabacteria bacterium]